MRALDIPCVDCQAPPGVPCIGRGGEVPATRKPHISRTRRAHYMTIAERADRRPIRTVGELAAGGDLIGVIREAIRGLASTSPELTESIAQAAARAVAAIPVRSPR